MQGLHNEPVSEMVHLRKYSRWQRIDPVEVEATGQRKMEEMEAHQGCRDPSSCPSEAGEDWISPRSPAL